MLGRGEFTALGRSGLVSDHRDYIGQVSRDVVRLLQADANPGEMHRRQCAFARCGEAVEEAILNALVAADTMTGQLGRVGPQLELVARDTPQHLARTWEVTEADIRWTDSLYPVAQHAMQRGYYMPNRNSRHCSRHQCPYWRRCEQDFGGVVEA